MEPLEALENELVKLIIETIALEDLAPEDVDRTEPLFVEGMGLDSIDALEIAMVLEQKYGVPTDDDAEANRARYQSIRTLARYVSETRTK